MLSNADGSADGSLADESEAQHVDYHRQDYQRPTPGLAVAPRSGVGGKKSESGS